MALVRFRKTTTIPNDDIELSNSKPRVVIAVDGTAASGKGTLAKKMADRLGYAYLDTGALYRAVGYATLEMNGNPSAYEDVAPALAIVKRNLTPELLANPALRTRAVAEAASKVAALPQVRHELVDYQRQFAKNPPGNVGGAILDGRDIGTVICPDADVKFYVTAAVEERAKRRLADMVAAREHATYEEILEDLRTRDLRDSTRATAPAVAAANAYQIDTTNLPANDALEEAIATIKSKFLSETIN